MQGTTLVLRQQQAYEAASLIREASILLTEALDKLDEHHLNLTNYPANWLDFHEHPHELRSISVYSTDDDTIQISADDAK